MAIAEMTRPGNSGVTENLLLRLEIEEFLTHEGALLDDRKFHDWADLLADDLEYWMPVRTTRAKGDEANEFAKIGEGAFFDDTKNHIMERIRKLETPYSWSEDPPSRTRHFTTNVRIVGRPRPDEFEVSCNFILYRGRLANHQDIWVGRRIDGLRRTAEGWKIYKRHIFMDQVSLLAKNLSVFF
jgi:3-phenylpropionate/cinnamic acid dioxygenase small subunit